MHMKQFLYSKDLFILIMSTFIDVLKTMNLKECHETVT